MPGAGTTNTLTFGSAELLSMLLFLLGVQFHIAVVDHVCLCLWDLNASCDLLGGGGGNVGDSGGGPCVVIQAAIFVLHFEIATVVVLFFFVF